MVPTSKKLIFIYLAIITLLYKGEIVNGKSLNLIIGGTEAKDGQFPYAVAIQKKSGTSHCTATLITKKTCLGAAQCTENNGGVSDVCGVVGQANIQKYSDCRDFSKIEIHPEYDGNKILNNIAIYIFKEEVKLGEYVKPITIIGEKDNIPEGQKVTVLGYGIESKDQPIEVRNNLHYVQLNLLSRSQCMSTSGGKNNLFCLEAEGKGPAAGDSGGPAVINRSGEDILIGLISYAEFSKNGATSRRSISTVVSSYTQWIIDHSDSKPKFTQ